MQHKELYSFANKYENNTDEELVTKIKNGDKSAQTCLFERYKDIVNMKANKFYIIGAEKEDMAQEGLIGLYKAIKSYDVDKQNSFKTFANLCIERQLITAIKSSNRQKHIPLNSSFSLNLSAYEENDDTTVIDVLDTKTAEDPLDTITKKEYIEFVESKIDESLSSFEKQVLNRYIQGESYNDIAVKLDTPIKSVDNAIQRIRKKACKFLENGETFE
ncbi:MAG: RNA polymerase sporulation sigma factor SigH [Clostridia bacterium]|nr:RNA polymerase sporulation sigma factor SigH [Clostridia bacterium]